MKEDHDDKAEDENGEEGVDIINEGDWGAPCFKGWVHFCHEDFLAG